MRRCILIRPLHISFLVLKKDQGSARRHAGWGDENLTGGSGRFLTLGPPVPGELPDPRAGLVANWTASKVVEGQIAPIREQIGPRRVLRGLSRSI